MTISMKAAFLSFLMLSVGAFAEETSEEGCGIFHYGKSLDHAHEDDYMYGNVCVRYGTKKLNLGDYTHNEEAHVIVLSSSHRTEISTITLTDIILKDPSGREADIEYQEDIKETLQPLQTKIILLKMSKYYPGRQVWVKGSSQKASEVVDKKPVTPSIVIPGAGARSKSTEADSTNSGAQELVRREAEFWTGKADGPSTGRASEEEMAEVRESARFWMGND